jgi:hypothetical protein
MDKLPSFCPIMDKNKNFCPFSLEKFKISFFLNLVSKNMGGQCGKKKK